jgi:hypothetical protein
MGHNVSRLVRLVLNECKRRNNARRQKMCSKCAIFGGQKKKKKINTNKFFFFVVEILSDKPEMMQWCYYHKNSISNLFIILPILPL